MLKSNSLKMHLNLFEKTIRSELDNRSLRRGLRFNAESDVKIDTNADHKFLVRC